MRDKRNSLKKKGSFSLPVFIIERSRAIEIVFVIAVLLSMLAAPFVNINYDLTRYLPDTVQSKAGLDLMEEKFGYPGTGRVMIEDVTLYEAKQYKDKLEKVDGVDQIMWLDTGTDVFLPTHLSTSTVLMITIKTVLPSWISSLKRRHQCRKTSRAIDTMQEITGEKGHYVGMAVQNKSLAENVTKEMKLILYSWRTDDLYYSLPDDKLLV